VLGIQRAKKGGLPLTVEGGCSLTSAEGSGVGVGISVGVGVGLTPNEEGNCSSAPTSPDFGAPQPATASDANTALIKALREKLLKAIVEIISPTEQIYDLRVTIYELWLRMIK